MRSLRLPLAAIAAASALALPSTASAHSQPSPGSIRAHAAQAQHTLGQLTTAVRRGREERAQRLLLANRRHTLAISREATALLGRRRATPAAAGLLAALRQQDRNLGAYARLIAISEEELSATLAQAAQAAAASRAAVLDALATLVPDLPERAQSRVSRVLAVLVADDSAQAGALAAAAALADLPPAAREALLAAFGSFETGVRTAFTALDEIVGQLPAPAQGAVRDAAEQLLDGLAQVRERLTALLDGGESTPAAGSLSQVLGAVLGAARRP